MIYEEKKEWLRRYRKAAKLEKIKLEEVERYRTYHAGALSCSRRRW